MSADLVVQPRVCPKQTKSSKHGMAAMTQNQHIDRADGRGRDLKVSPRREGEKRDEEAFQVSSAAPLTPLFSMRRKGRSRPFAGVSEFLVPASASVASLTVATNRNPFHNHLLFVSTCSLTVIDSCVTVRRKASASL